MVPFYSLLCCHNSKITTVYPKKYAHGFCFAVLCCGYTLTDFPISIRLTSLALWQSNDCPSASKATLMNMDKYFMWIHYERLHNHNKAKHNKTVCIFLGIYCMKHSEQNHSFYDCTPAMDANTMAQTHFLICWHFVRNPLVISLFLGHKSVIQSFVCSLLPTWILRTYVGNTKLCMFFVANLNT